MGAPEEIKVVVTQEAKGPPVVEKTKKDLDELEKQQGKKNVSAPDFFTEVHARTQAHKQAAKEKAVSDKEFAASYKREWTAAINQEKKQKVEAAKEAAKAQNEAALQSRQKEHTTLFEDEVRAQEMRHSGDKKGADALEKQVGIRRRSMQLERDLGVTREHATKLAEREAAVLKAKGGHGGNLGTARMVGEGLDMATGGSGYVMRAMSVARVGAMIGEAGPVGMIAAAVLAPAILYGIYRSIRKGTTDRNRAAGNKLREEGIGDESRIERLHKYGSAEEAADLGISLAEENKQLRGHYQTLDDESHAGIMGGISQWIRNKTGWDPATRGLPGVDFYKPEGFYKKEELSHEEQRNAEQQRKAAEERKRWVEKVTMPGIEASELHNQGKHAEARQIEIDVAAEEERKRLEKLMPDDHAGVERGVAAKRKELEEGGYATFQREGGATAIAMQEKLNEGKVREAMVLKDNISWWNKYNAVLAEVGPAHAEVAKQAADAEVFGEQRRRAGAFSGALDARAGAAETARVATFAAHAMGLDTAPKIVDALQVMHGTMRDQHNESTEKAWRAKFTRKHPATS